MQARRIIATPRIGERLDDFCFCCSMHALEVYLLEIIATEYAWWKQLSLDFEHSFFGAHLLNASVYGCSILETSFSSLNTCRILVLGGLAFNKSPLRAPLAVLIPTKVMQSYSILRIFVYLEIMHEIAQHVHIAFDYQS